MLIQSDHLPVLTAAEGADVDEFILKESFVSSSIAKDWMSLPAPSAPY